MVIRLFAVLACLGASMRGLADEPWPRYAIDSSLRGADGVRLADANGDGLPDIATGWEESGTARIYLHPGVEAVHAAWPLCTVGSAPSVEDAVWVDFDRNGSLDVLTSCEGKEQSLRVHFAPSHADSLLDADAWTTQIIPASHGLTRWMYCLPVPDASKPDYIVVSSKAPGGMVGLLHLGESIEQARVQKLADAQWIMSLESLDVDRDGDLDILYSDRKGEQAAVYWLENPGARADVGQEPAWPKHLIGGLGQEVMFLKLVPQQVARATASGAPRLELVVATKPYAILWLKQQADSHQPWAMEELIVGTEEQIGPAKGVAVADLTGDGQLDLVFSCESATPPKSGVVMLTRSAGTWQMRDISGPQGIKFDLLQLVDLDCDGDLDILTCEERHEQHGLGVIWYANPR